MSASSSTHPSKQLLSSHEPRSTDSTHSLHPTSAHSSQPHYHKPDNHRPANTRRALHYNTPQSSVSPRSASTPNTTNGSTTPYTASTANTTLSSSDLVDLDTWQSNTELQLERLIINAELVLSQEKQRVRLGLMTGGSGMGTADSFEQLDDKEQHDVLDLIAQAKRLEYGVVKELHDIQRSVAEEKENTTDGKETTDAASPTSTSSHSNTTAEHVRRMAELIALLEAKVDDLQADIDSNKPNLAQLNTERSAKNQLQNELTTLQQQTDQLSDQLHQLQQQHRSQQQLNAQLTQQLADVSGQYEGTEALLSQEKDRSSRLQRDVGELKADKRTLEDNLLVLAGREQTVAAECDRRLVMYDSVRRDSVRLRMLGVVCVGLAVLVTGVAPWMNEYVRADPRMYTF